MPVRFAAVALLVSHSIPALAQERLPAFQMSTTVGGFWPRPVRPTWVSNGLASHPFGQRVYLAASVEAGGFFDGVWYAGVQGFRHEYAWQYSFRRALSQHLVSVGGGPVLGRVVAARRRWDLTARLSPTLLYSIYQGSANLDTGYFTDPARQHLEMRRIGSTVQRDFFAVVEASAVGVWRATQRHGLTARVAYMQGFRPFITDRVEIRDAVSGATAEFETRITGSGLRFEAGYAYGFVPRRRTSTRYREVPPGGGFERHWRR